MKVWMADITYAGHVWRFATRTVRVEISEGNTVLYNEGLSLEWVDSFEMGCELAPRRFDQELIWPEVVALTSRDFGLEDATWSLYVADAARPWGRTLMLTGHIEGVEYGAASEPVRFTMTHRILPTAWPPQTISISPTDWAASGTPPEGVTEIQEESVGQPYTIPVGYTPVLPGPMGIWPLNIITQAGVREFTSTYSPALALGDNTWHTFILDSVTIQSTYPVTITGTSGGIPWTLEYEGTAVSNSYVDVVNHGAMPWEGDGYQLTLILQATATGDLNTITSYRQETWLACLIDDPSMDFDMDGDSLTATSELNNPWTSKKYSSDTDLASADTLRWLAQSVGSAYNALYLQIPRYQIHDEITSTGTVEGAVDLVCEDTRHLRYTVDGGTYLGSCTFAPDPVTQPYSLLHSNPIRLSIALLERTGLPYDAAAWEALVPTFESWQMGFYLESIPQNLFVVLQDEIWSWLPLQVYWGPLGITPRQWLPDADAGADLVAGQGLERLGSVRRAGRDVYNAFSLGFNRTWGQADPPHRSRLALGPNINGESAPWVIESAARLGQRDYRLTNSDSIRGSAEVEGGAAWGWLAWKSRYHARDPQVVRYWMDDGRELAVGSIVTITDSALYLEARRAFVRRVRWLETGYELTLELQELALPAATPNNLLRTADWTLEPAGGSVSISEGTAYTAIPLSSVRPYDAANGYTGPSAYTVAGEAGNISVYVRVTALTATSNGYDNLGVGIRNSSGSLRYSTLLTGDGDVYAHAHHWNSNLAHVTPGTLGLTGYGWLRIRQASNLITFEYGTSVNGVPSIWTTLHTATETTPLDCVFFFLRQVISGHTSTVTGQLQTLILE